MFQVGLGHVFFMDSDFVLYKLIRNSTDRNLKIIKEFTMKDIQRFDFCPGDFAAVMLDEKYIIFRDKIFYIQEIGKNVYPDGIMESEDLIEEERSKAKLIYNSGPFHLKGSIRFYDVFRPDKFCSFIRIF